MVLALNIQLFSPKEQVLKEVTKMPLLSTIIKLLVRIVRNFFAFFTTDIYKKVAVQQTLKQQMEHTHQQLAHIQTQLPAIAEIHTQLSLHQQELNTIHHHLRTLDRAQIPTITPAVLYPPRILHGLTQRPPIDTTVPYTGHVNTDLCQQLLLRHAPRFLYAHAHTEVQHTISNDSWDIQIYGKPNIDKETNEDAMLVDMQSNELFCVIADGVSSTPMSNIAAAYVCQHIHVEWKLSMHYHEFDEHNLYTKTQQLIREALYQAKYHVNETVQNIIHDRPKNNISTALQANLDEKGSHATFALVFTMGSYVVCAWMGNTRIICQSDFKGSIIHPNDARFTDDMHRFSSHDDTVPNSGGMRGMLFIQIIDMRQVPSWRIIVISDGLDDHKQHIISHSHVQPQESLHSIIDDAAQHDDCSLIDITYTQKDTLHATTQQYG